MKEITDIQIHKAFTNRDLRHKFYPQTGDYMLKRDTAVRHFEEVQSLFSSYVLSNLFNLCVANSTFMTTFAVATDGEALVDLFLLI